ncbi:MAG: bifunctional adenosylcobinamide kinase/adenosylcobinamide-phosphate guanylyltransferase [Christensenellaceae bacterium]|nr:bifunctional adenosylcobinamide kinase/adenosylcobinamide-phosphate guanylyltransferase [Christensenellaceae bacterium]
MLIFLSGGAKNGKSTLAQDLSVSLCKNKKLYYLATMIPTDAEDDARIVRHISERDGLGFQTVEHGKKLAECKADAEGTYLLDSVTALLANEMFLADGTADVSAAERVARELCDFADRVKNVVFVSDYIYGDGRIYDEFTEEYRKGLAQIDRVLAAKCDVVAEVMHGVPICYKGKL